MVVFHSYVAVYRRVLWIQLLRRCRSWRFTPHLRVLLLPAAEPAVSDNSCGHHGNPYFAWDPWMCLSRCPWSDVHRIRTFPDGHVEVDYWWKADYKGRDWHFDQFFSFESVCCHKSWGHGPTKNGGSTGSSTKKKVSDTVIVDFYGLIIIPLCNSTITHPL